MDAIGNEIKVRIAMNRLPCNPESSRQNQNLRILKYEYSIKYKDRYVEFQTENLMIFSNEHFTNCCFEEIFNIWLPGKALQEKAEIKPCGNRNNWSEIAIFGMPKQ